LNAIDPAPRSVVDPGTVDLLAAVRLARRVTGVAFAAALVITGIAISRLHPVIVGPALAATITALAAMCCGWLMAWARWRTVQPPRLASPRWRLARHLPVIRWVKAGDRGLVASAARLPQVLITLPLCAAAIAAIRLFPPAIASTDQHTGYVLAAGALGLSFPVLLAERFLAASPIARSLPEAPDLRSLLVSTLFCFIGTSVLTFGATLGFGWLAENGLWLFSIIPVAIAVELAARALARLFLPGSIAAEASGACRSTISLILAEGIATRSVATPISHHLGIDFARGFALRFVSAALPSVALCVVLAAWGLTGVVPVPADQRAIYERLGAPVRVMPPGLHLILPWPLGKVRMVEYGPLHSLPLGDVPGDVPLFGAEDTPPPSADRLWEQAHPAEVTFLIASESGGRQNFQLVAADVRAVWRISLTDADALYASYAVEQPASLLRAAVGRALADFFAGETLSAVLGEGREPQAARLRSGIQAELDRDHAGIELTDLVIEAVHPPAGAAEAYHAVQAAEIMAQTQVSAEQGRAQAALAKTSQYVAEIVTTARGQAADTVADARAAASSFTADVSAAHVGGASFLFDRYLYDLGAALSGTPVTILDSRIPAPNAPMLDLRPPGSLPAPSTGAE
jgi:regulator of protease activity HflC (stomatin/prohibitin superfamily)